MLRVNIGKAPWHTKERYTCLKMLTYVQQCTAKFVWEKSRHLYRENKSPPFGVHEIRNMSVPKCWSELYKNKSFCARVFQF